MPGLSLPARNVEKTRLKISWAVVALVMASIPAPGATCGRPEVALWKGMEINGRTFRE